MPRTGMRPPGVHSSMWWNSVGRTDDEIRTAREDWMASDRFGEVKGYDGDPLDAPEVPAAQLKAWGRVR